MDSTYRPQSPDLGSYQPQSPDLAGLRPESPDLSGLGSPRFGNFSQHQQQRFPGAFGGGNNGFGGGYQPTSVPQFDPQFDPDQQYNQQQQFGTMPPHQPVKDEDDEDDFMPDAQPSRRSRKVKQEPVINGMSAPGFTESSYENKSEASDPTLGCQLKTSFPVARIKRIMQADEDIGKVAQVTPTVVSRALELFMIKLISASANQAGGTGAGGASKGPRRILAQHLKRAVLDDEKFDFLNEIVEKVPDAPAKAKKETGSDSEDPKPKKRGKKRKDSGDDI